MRGERPLQLALVVAVVVGMAVLATREPSTPGLLIERRDPPPGVDDVRVYVTGAVRAPGVVTVEPGARIGDAVERAGGLAADADPAAVNLARRVADEDQVVVPRFGEATALLDINTASSAELEQLPGIGPVYAQRVVEARTHGGAFATTDELLDRDVLPARVYEQIRDLIDAR